MLQSTNPKDESNTTKPEKSPLPDLPLFAQILSDHWFQLAPLLQKRYSNRPYHHDQVSVQGIMTLKSTLWMQIIKPFLKISGALVQQDGEDVPVTVHFKSDPHSAHYWFERQFHFKKPEYFKSHMIWFKENMIVEFMRFHLGWRARLSVQNSRLLMSHDAYVFHFFRWFIPVPAELIMGKCDLFEEQVSDDTFKMNMQLNHFLFGTIYEYKGTFKIIALKQD